MENILDCFIDYIKHKRDKSIGFSLKCRLGNGFIIIVLVIFDNAFDWNPFKNGFPRR